MNRNLLGSVAVLAALASTSAWAQDGAALAAKFGALEAVQQISLSPDGTKVAYIAPAGEASLLYIGDLVAGGTKPILRSPRKDGELSWCSWASDARLVCQVYYIIDDAGQLLTFTRMIALDADGKNVVRLTPGNSSRALGIMQNGGSVIDWDIPGKPGSVLMTRQYVPETTIGTNISAKDEGLGVEEVDTASLKRKPVERARGNAVEYITDGAGNVRIMGTQGTVGEGYMASQVKYFYRTAQSREWEQLSTLSLTGTGSGFNPYAVDAAKNVVYGFDDAGGYQGLYTIGLQFGGKKELVLARNDVDIDRLVRIGRDRRVVGASYATERREVEYFDPELKKLSAALGKALPAGQSIGVVDASTGEKRLLMFASRDTAPGTFYVFDKTARKLEEVLPVRPQLEGIKLAEMKPVTFPAADGTQIPAYLTLPPGGTGKNLPTIVMPHGGPSARDVWGFDWLVQFYAARGYAVLQPNYRGSAGYGAAYYQKNGFQSWRTAIGDVNDAGRWLVSQGIADPGKLAIVGWSYGGYAALQSSVLDPGLFKAIVAVAPVADLERLRSDARGYTNYSLVDKEIGHGAYVREGSPAQNAARIAAPVLLFHGDKDINVNIGHSRLMADKLRGAGKQVTLVEFPGLDHALDSPTARTRLLSESDVFLRKALGIAP